MCTELCRVLTLGVQAYTALYSPRLRLTMYTAVSICATGTVSVLCIATMSIDVAFEIPGGMSKSWKPPWAPYKLQPCPESPQLC